MSDIKWIEGEIPKPGTCISCGSADHANRRFMTFTRFIKFYGKVLLCSECVNSILHLPGLDFVPRIDLEMAKTEAAVYRERVEPALDALRSIRSGFDELCGRYLNSDGSPKDQKVKLFTGGRSNSGKSTGNKNGNSSGSPGFFDNEPEPAA